MMPESKMTGFFWITIFQAIALTVAVIYFAVARNTDLAKSEEQSTLWQQQAKELDGKIAESIPPGTIMAYTGIKLPEGWLWCDGSEKRKEDFPLLADLLGSAWGDARMGFFKLPDLSRRTLVGMDRSDDRKVGMRGGQETVKLEVKHLPRHNHGFSDPGHSHNQAVAVTPLDGKKKENDLRTADILRDQIDSWRHDHQLLTWPSKTGITVLYEGEDSPHENMPPFAVVSWIIKQ